MNELYNRVGGEQFFFDLVGAFYAGVTGDPLLRPLYPEDMAESIHHLTLFLIQYWGGPSTYNELRGHPRLRMRHVPFVIGPGERDAWLHHMMAAVEHMAATTSLSEADAAELGAYFEMAATSLTNAP
jgi:hemoglobin